MVMWMRGNGITGFWAERLTGGETQGCECYACRSLRLRDSQNPNAITPKQAEDLAVVLLGNLLGDHVVVEAIQRGYFEVTGSEGGQFRLFTRSYAGNIAYRAMGSSWAWSTLCAHLTTADECSRFENILGQVEMIKTDELRFRKIAL